MRIFSTPRPVPVLIQSWENAGRAIAQTSTATKHSAARRKEKWSDIKQMRSIVLRQNFRLKQLSYTNIGAASSTSCNQTRTLPKLCFPNNLAGADQMYRFAAMPAPPTCQARALRSTVRPPRAMGVRCDRCQMSHTRDWLPGFEDLPHISASSRKPFD